MLYISPVQNLSCSMNSNIGMNSLPAKSQEKIMENASYILKFEEDRHASVPTFTMFG